jgi:hypothetical protein
MIKRSERITVRVSPDEEAWIITEAEKTGVSKSRYLRQVALCQRPQAEVPFSKSDRPVNPDGPLTNAELKQVLNQDLPKIANNINQLARHVNEQRDIGPRQTEELVQYRKDLDELTLTIIEALS